MSQTALPIADVSDTGWTPTPVYAQINAPTPTDATDVSSSLNPQGDTFEVQLAPLAWPGPGQQQLTVRLKKTGSDNVSVIVTLLQGSTPIADMTVQPGTSFAGYTLTLTNAQIAQITDYGNLHVRVTAGVALVSGCSACPSGAAKEFRFTPSGISNGAVCTQCSALNVLTSITYQSGCTWQSATQICTHVWIFSYQGSGLWQLVWGDAVYQVTAPSWDCQSALTLNLVSSTGNSCKNYPASITINPA
jgi:hypothetical protein